MDSQPALSPADVVQTDGNDFAGAESVGGDQQKHRVVAQPHRGLPVDAFQQRRYGVPRESARQLLKPVKPRSVDLAIQPGTYPAIRREKPKQPANGGDLMLQACATQTTARLGDVRFDIAGLNGTERNTG